MQREQLHMTLFLLVAAVIFYLFARIMLPFLIPICWAAVFAIIFYPLQDRLLRVLKNRSLAALVMSLMVIVLIIGPIAYLFVAVVYQAAGAVAAIDKLNSSGQLRPVARCRLAVLAVDQEAALAVLRYDPGRS